MREALLLAIAVIAFVGAAFVPGGAADTARESAGDLSSEAVPAPQPTAQASSPTGWSTGETQLPRSGDGHFYAQVKINGRPVEFLVDTGASVVALTGADASALGLFWNPAEVGVIGSGASGPVMGVPVTLDSVQFGGHEARAVEAVIIPEGLGISLLGQSFLATVNPVRIEDDRMVLGS